MQNVSRSVVIAALVAITALITAAVLFVSGDAAMERLALLIAFAGTVVPGLVGALRADQAAKSTDNVSSIAQALNGGFEARVRNANRETANETGTAEDAMRAQADAETSAALLSHTPPNPPVTANPIVPPGTAQ